MRLSAIKNRRDFVDVSNKGAKFVVGTFILLTYKRTPDHPVKDVARIGYTVTKKMGNAVHRNRIKRRLREAVRMLGESHAKAGHDYVVIARIKALTCDFTELTRDMEFAFSRITTNKKPTLT